MSAIKNFESMLERGQDGEMLRFTLGNAYWKEGRPAEAIVHLEKAVEFKPEWSAAWKVLGRALTDNGELVRAVSILEHASEVAEQQGDKQTGKEIAVFLKRARKALDGN